jgi:hypothetical protein
MDNVPYWQATLLVEAWFKRFASCKTAPFTDPGG